MIIQKIYSRKVIKPHIYNLYPLTLVCYTLLKCLFKTLQPNHDWFWNNNTTNNTIPEVQQIRGDFKGNANPFRVTLKSLEIITILFTEICWPLLHVSPKGFLCTNLLSPHNNSSPTSQRRKRRPREVKQALKATQLVSGGAAIQESAIAGTRSWGLLSSRDAPTKGTLSSFLGS